jgi:hypothetical protein
MPTGRAGAVDDEAVLDQKVVGHGGSTIPWG